MIPFADFFKDLCSNYVWYERAIIHHKPETFKKVCDDVYTIHSADQNRSFPPIEESRRFVSNKLNKINPDKVKVDWSKQAHEQAEAEQKAKEQPWIPLTGEERAKKLAEFKAMIDAAPIINSMPPMSIKEQVEQGGVIPPRHAPYPTTSPGELYKKERHIAWIEACFDARTKEPLACWMDEKDFNEYFDMENRDEYFKQFQPKKL